MRPVLFISAILLTAASAWPQAVSAGSEPIVNVEDRMLVPAPASAEAYPIGLSSEERSNYLHYGLTFSAGYTDNLLGGATSTGHPVSDFNYSVWPTIGFDRSTTRLHLGVTYAPGFTFYERTSERNEADHNALLAFEYRISPHVTFSARDSFQKSSNVLNQPSVTSGDGVSGSAQGPNVSVIAPVADRLSNFGTLGLTYQYAANDMVGINGTFGNLHYGNLTEVSGLSDDSSKSGSAFYSHRLTHRHYVGAIYQYQTLLVFLSGSNSETQTHAALCFYTVYPSANFSISLYGGPQYEGTFQPPLNELPAYSSRGWSPVAGASLNWRGHFTSAAFSYSHSIRSGGGLKGAVLLDEASAAGRVQFTPTLSALLSAGYANNQMIGPSLGDNGHTIEGTIGVQRRFGERIGVELGYSRIHQTYSIPVLSMSPDTNRVSISVSYSFMRPWGR